MKVKTLAYPLHGHGAAIAIPNDLAESFIVKKIKRLLCTFEDGQQLHASIHTKDDFHFMMLGKQMAKQHNVIPGDELTVQIEEDTTCYQMAVSEEFKEVLMTDPEGEHHFHRLTPGKQRSLLHSINKVKSSDLRITKALRLMENLKTGETDLKLLLK